ncbi:hypothetical protein HKX48_000254 [Thoreauomyces humboldtii]|nr:hypothetical protein HKX48_000254 [Thoreauomyces humboldtii]
MSGPPALVQPRYFEKNTSYSHKLILAPMVRVGTLPMRLLALHYGADLVYSPETVDRRLIKSDRVVNHLLGTIDYVCRDDGTLTLRMHPGELGRLVVQLGTGDPDLAVKAASVVAGDVSGIDLNCGCPKRFSLVSSMGAALLGDPDRLVAILTALKREIPLPITCKIRLLPATSTQTTMERTADLMRRIEATGVAAIGVHCRFQTDRQQDPARWHELAPLARAVNIPVIANGDVFGLDDVRKLTGLAEVNSFMLARAPQYNVSVFRKDGVLPIRQVMDLYTRTAITYDMVGHDSVGRWVVDGGRFPVLTLKDFDCPSQAFHNAKFCLLLMWPSSLGKEFREEMARTKSWEAMSEKLGLLDFYRETMAKRAARAAELEAASSRPVSRDPSVAPEAAAKDRLAEEDAELGPDCPYIPDAPDYDTVAGRTSNGRLTASR